MRFLGFRRVGFWGISAGGFNFEDAGRGGRGAFVVSSVVVEALAKFRVVGSWGIRVVVGERDEEEGPFFDGGGLCGWDYLEI